MTDCSCSGDYGGGIYSNGSSTIVENFTFFDCYSYGGGAICFNQENSIARREKLLRKREMIDEEKFIPYTEGFIELLFFNKNIRGVLKDGWKE